MLLPGPLCAFIPSGSQQNALAHQGTMCQLSQVTPDAADRVNGTESEEAVQLQVWGLKTSAKSNTTVFSYLLALTDHSVKATPQQECHSCRRREKLGQFIASCACPCLAFYSYPRSHLPSAKCEFAVEIPSPQPLEAQCSVWDMWITRGPAFCRGESPATPSWVEAAG